MRRKKTIIAAKFAAYVLVLLVLYVLQTTPGLFAIFGVKPMLVVPAAIAIAMYEGEFVGGLFGAFAGLLCDMGSSMLFGFNGLFTAFFCVLAGLAVANLMHCNAWNATGYVAVAMLVTRSAEFFFGYAMWGYDYVGMIFVRQTLPLIVYTALVTPLMFWLVRALHMRARRAIDN